MIFELCFARLMLKLEHEQIPSVILRRMHVLKMLCTSLQSSDQNHSRPRASLQEISASSRRAPVFAFAMLSDFPQSSVHANYSVIACCTAQLVVPLFSS